MPVRILPSAVANLESRVVKSPLLARSSIALAVSTSFIHLKAGSGRPEALAISLRKKFFHMRFKIRQKLEDIRLFLQEKCLHD